MISNILPWTFSNSKTSVQSVHPLRNELKKSRCRIIENAQGGSSKRLVVGLYKMKKIRWKSITQGSGLAELNRRQQVPWSAYADPSPGAFYLQPLYFFFLAESVGAPRRPEQDRWLPSLSTYLDDPEASRDEKAARDLITVIGNEALIAAISSLASSSFSFLPTFYPGWKE